MSKQNQKTQSDLFERAVIALMNDKGLIPAGLDTKFIDKLNEYKGQIIAIDQGIQSAQQSISNMMQQRERAIGSTEAIIDLMRDSISDSTAQQIIDTASTRQSAFAAAAAKKQSEPAQPSVPGAAAEQPAASSEGESK